MSREIKFRAWNEKTKRMVDCHKATPLAVHPELLAEDLDGVFVPFSKELILMQYTGLKDKNGVDLDWWEGDLICTFNYTEHKGVWEIKFLDGCFWGVEIGGRNRKKLLSDLAAYADTPELLGNIHENPELLE